MTPLSERIARYADPEIPLVSVESMNNVPYGYCHCGCGRKAPLAKQTRKERGYVEGFPIYYCHGHSARKKRELEDAVPFRIDGVYCRFVPLTRGFHAIVREEDYESAMLIRWNAASDKSGNTYAISVYKNLGGERRVIKMHDFIFGPTSPGKTVDHINRCPLDNRLGNLREAVHLQQCWNQGKRTDRKYTSKYKGVCRYKDEVRFNSHINYMGKKIKLGGSRNEEEAARIYDRAAIRLFGEFAVLNFPRSDYPADPADL